MRQIKISILIENNKHKILKLFCAEHETSIKDFVLDAVFEKINALKNKQNNIEKGNENGI